MQATTTAGAIHPTMLIIQTYLKINKLEFFNSGYWRKYEKSVCIWNAGTWPSQFSYSGKYCWLMAEGTRTTFRHYGDEGLHNQGDCAIKILAKTYSARGHI